MSWHPKQITDAAQLWRQVWLVTGGSHDSARQHCGPRSLGICSQAGGEMPCGCRHWMNISHHRRAIWIAVRAGMPIGLIARNAGVDAGDIAIVVDIITRLAEVQPGLLAHAERITARVPMWGERIARRMAERSDHAIGV